MNRIRHNLVYFAVDAQKNSAQQMLEARSDHSAPLRTAMVGVYKALRKPVLEGIGHSVGGEYLSMGCEQIVYKTGKGKVAKVLRESVTLGSEEVDALIEMNQGLTDTAASHMGDQWTETTFRGVKMPAYIGGYAVVATQPEITPTTIFTNGEAILEHKVDEEFVDELGRFVKGVKSLKNTAGMYPDLIGEGNIVMTRKSNTSQILVLDTLPVPPARLAEVSADGLRTHGDMHRDIMDRIEARYDRFIRSTGSLALALH